MRKQNYDNGDGIAVMWKGKERNVEIKPSA